MPNRQNSIMDCMSFLIFFFSVVFGIAFEGALAKELLPIDPIVNQENLDATICIRGWTKSIRPPVSVTGPIKRKMMVQAGVPPEGEDDIKLDHIIPLALGGAANDLRNFALQPADEARDKDRVEVCLARSVCARKVSLEDAQRAIWENWHLAGRLCSGYELLR